VHAGEVGNNGSVGLPPYPSIQTLFYCPWPKPYEPKQTVWTPKCGVLYQKPQIVELRSLFFEKFENNILFFKKNLKLNVDVYNVVIYNCVNFQVKIYYVLSCEKMIKSDIYNSE
jgi:hypothetical protein